MMNIWLRQHAFAFHYAIKQLLKSPGNFALNVMVIAISLALPVTGLTLLENIRPLSEQLAVEPEISIFAAMDTPREQATAFGSHIHRIVQAANSSARLEFIPREKALNTLKDRTGLSEALMVLGENPLPDGYVLKLTGFRNAADATRVDAIAAQLKALPGVEYVQVDSVWVKRLAALIHIFHLILLFLGITLSIVVMAVVFNTIRLQILTRHEEIEICRVFGATDAYICRPFYYTGILLGLLAGVVTLLTVATSLPLLNTAITEFALLYGSEFRLTRLNAILTLLTLAISALLGLIGTQISLKRHLKHRI